MGELQGLGAERFQVLFQAEALTTRVQGSQGSAGLGSKPNFLIPTYMQSFSGCQVAGKSERGDCIHDNPKP